ADLEDVVVVEIGHRDHLLDVPVARQVLEPLRHLAVRHSLSYFGLALDDELVRLARAAAGDARGLGPFRARGVHDLRRDPLGVVDDVAERAARAAAYSARAR